MANREKNFEKYNDFSEIIRTETKLKVKKSYDFFLSNPKIAMIEAYLKITLHIKFIKY